MNIANKKQIIKNQQVEKYQMYRNKLPWEINSNAGQMFNGHNSQLADNEYKQTQYQNQKSLKILIELLMNTIEKKKIVMVLELVLD